MLADLAINERQKRVLIDVYQSFVKENEKDGSAPQPDSGPEESVPATNEDIPNEGDPK